MAASVDFQLAQLEVVPQEVPLKILPPPEPAPETKKLRPQNFLNGFSHMDYHDQIELLWRLKGFVEAMQHDPDQTEAEILLIKAAIDNPELLKLLGFDPNKTPQQILDLMKLYTITYPREDAYYRDLLDRFIADFEM